MNSVIVSLLQHFINHGYQAYIVGGFVRDVVNGFASADIDIATDATPDQVQQLFTKTIDVGAMHGSLKVEFEGSLFDITTFRVDGDYANHRHPEHVEYGHDLDMDVRRRDFTMNGLAMDIEGKVIDYVDGQADIKQQVIRAIGNPHQRMQEDALRIVRALRFVSQLGFTIEETLWQAIIDHQLLVDHVSIERVQMELKKLCKGPYLNKVNPYLSKLSMSYVPRHVVEDSSLSFIEQLAIAHMTNHIDSLPFALSKQERNLLSYLIQLPKQSPDRYTLYCSMNVVSMIQVGRHVYGWDAKTLFDLYESLVIHSRQQLAIRGDEIQALGITGKMIEDTLTTLERLVVEEKIANRYDELMASIKEMHDEN